MACPNLNQGATRIGRTSHTTPAVVSPMALRQTPPMTHARANRNADGKIILFLRALDLSAQNARTCESKAPGHVSGAGDPDPHPSRNLNWALLAEELEGCLIQRQLIVDDCHAQSLAQATRA